MPLTVTNVVQQLYRYLAKEQRAIPFVPGANPDLADPLPEALIAINGALQHMAASCPVFAAKQARSAYFRAPATIAVSGLTKGAKSFPLPEDWQPWMVGCHFQLPGDDQANRIARADDTHGFLQFPHLGTDSAGSATVTADLAELDSDIIQVLPVVRTREGVPLHPARGRFDLSRPRRVTREDYGRDTSCSAEGGHGLGYYIETLIPAAGGQARLAMLLHPAPATDTVIEFEARTSLGWFTADDVLAEGVDAGTYIPVPAQFVEAIFLPLALWRFFGSSVMRNADVPRFIEQQAAAAEKLLQGMRPQTDKKAAIRPTW